MEQRYVTFWCKTISLLSIKFKILMILNHIDYLCLYMWCVCVCGAPLLAAPTIMFINVIMCVIMQKPMFYSWNLLLGWAFPTQTQPVIMKILEMTSQVIVIIIITYNLNILLLNIVIKKLLLNI